MLRSYDAATTCDLVLGEDSKELMWRVQSWEKYVGTTYTVTWLPTIYIQLLVACQGKVNGLLKIQVISLVIQITIC